MDPQTHPRFGDQAALERDMRQAGVERYRKLVAAAKEKGREDETPAGAKMLRRTVGALSDAIAAHIEKVTEKTTAGRHGSAMKYLPLVSEDVAAVVTLRVVISHIHRGRTVQATAMRVGRAIEDEVRFADFEASSQPHKALFRKVRAHQESKSGNRQRRRRVMAHMVRKAGHEWSSWPDADVLHLGLLLLDLAVEATGLVRFETQYLSDKNTPIHLVLTDEARSWLAETNSRNELLLPTLLPCIIPPKDWDGPVGGGYWTRALPVLKLVKTRNWNYLEELRYKDMGLVYTALNAIQRTAWRVNAPVLGVVKALWESGSSKAGLPPRRDALMPTKPADIDTNPDSLRRWKRARRDAELVNVRLGSKRLQVAKGITIAERFVAEPEIYFPYTLDFRGRLYARPDYLQPQGDDMAKGLLTFANGKPLGTVEAADWLAIHGANLFGYDKVSFAERVEWVQKNQEAILASAADPTGVLWWVDADKPWQFLAFCFEWAGYQRDGLQFVSRLPIALDGSCNGLQHFSAMLKDPVGGAAVNLIPSEKPQDIYQRVADVVVGALKVEKEDPEMANRWLAFGINRKTTKRCVMVLPYGGTEYSFRAFVKEHITDRKESGEEHPFGTDKECWSAAVFLAKHITQAIGSVVVSAVSAMTWLQEVSVKLGEEGLPVTWTAPTGFPVLQAYWKQKGRRVKTKMMGEVVQLILQEDTNKLDQKRQASGISPNFVHSLDAAALMFTVDAAAAFGVDSFAMVHDSYATVAADTGTLAVCLRQAFVQMYSFDVLKAFRDEVSAVLSEGKELPPLPPSGDLDVSQVLQSDFFFA